jgi:di/tricarboxylate transporter
MQTFCREHGLILRGELRVFGEILANTRIGLAEVVIPPSSRLIGKTVLDIRMRKSYGLNVMSINRMNEAHRTGFKDFTLQVGDMLMVHTLWRDLAKLEGNQDFAIVTTNYPHDEVRPNKVPHALVFLLIALGLVLFTDVLLSIALLTGAVGMILSGVLSMDEAYDAVDWKTVFLLASLIPLGVAMQNTGTAAWIAQETLHILGDVAPWVLQATIALLATFLTLTVSNVGATVLLVPLAVNIAVQSGADPRLFALTVAVATSNSFLIPTHQVNALIMGPAGYRVADYIRAGGIMTVLFLVVALLMLNLVF